MPILKQLLLMRGAGKNVYTFSNARFKYKTQAICLIGYVLMMDQLRKLQN